MTNILTWLADLFQSLFSGPGRQINNLNVNLENAYKQLDLIQRAYSTGFQKDPQNYLNRDGALWFIRKGLETARYYYTGGREGYPVSDRVKDLLKVHLLDPRFQELKDVLAETEKKVIEMERTKGYQFVSVDDNNIIFRNISTGKVLSSADSSHV